MALLDVEVLDRPWDNLGRKRDWVTLVPCRRLEVEASLVARLLVLV